MSITRTGIGVFFIGVMLLVLSACRPSVVDHQILAKCEDLTQIVVAVEDIELGQTFTREMVTTALMPRAFIPSFALRPEDIESHLGQRIDVNIPKNDMISKRDFRIRDVRRQLDAAIEHDGSATTRISEDETVAILELASGYNAFVGKLIVQPDVNLPPYHNTTEEYLYILEGNARMLIDGRAYDLSPSTTIFIPAAGHVIIENGSEVLVAIQVFAGPEGAERYNSWEIR